MAVDRQYNVRVTIVSNTEGASQATAALDKLHSGGKEAGEGVNKAFEKLNLTHHEEHQLLRILGSSMGEFGHLAHYALNPILLGSAAATLAIHGMVEAFEKLNATSAAVTEAIAERMDKLHEAAVTAAEDFAKAAQAYKDWADSIGQNTGAINEALDSTIARMKEEAKLLGIGDVAQTGIEKALAGKALIGTADAMKAAAGDSAEAQARALGFKGSGAPGTYQGEIDKAGKDVSDLKERVKLLNEYLNSGLIGRVAIGFQHPELGMRFAGRTATAEGKLTAAESELSSRQQYLDQEKEKLASFNREKDAADKDAERRRGVFDKLYSQFEGLSQKMELLNDKSRIGEAGEHLESGLGRIFMGGDGASISSTLGGLGMGADQIARFERAIAGAQADPALMDRILTVAERMAYNNSLHNSDIANRVSKLESRINSNHSTRTLPGS